MCKWLWIKTLLVHLPLKYILAVRALNFFLHSCMIPSCILDIWWFLSKHTITYMCYWMWLYGIMLAITKPQHNLQCQRHFCICYLLIAICSCLLLDMDRINFKYIKLLVWQLNNIRYDPIYYRYFFKIIQISTMHETCLQ